MSREKQTASTEDEAVIAEWRSLFANWETVLQYYHIPGDQNPRGRNPLPKFEILQARVNDLNNHWSKHGQQVSALYIPNEGVCFPNYAPPDYGKEEIINTKQEPTFTFYFLLEDTAEAAERKNSLRQAKKAVADFRFAAKDFEELESALRNLRQEYGSIQEAIDTLCKMGFFTQHDEADIEMCMARLDALTEHTSNHHTERRTLGNTEVAEALNNYFDADSL